MNEEAANNLFERISDLEYAVKRLSVRTDLMIQMFAMTAALTNIPNDLYSKQLRMVEPTRVKVGLPEILEKEISHIEFELNNLFSKIDEARKGV
ncbi:hypothetical protein ACNY98_002521 [Klebsiella variicola]|nr:hypothetical protein [Klebsiella pneumoniae]HCI7019834.1 hypothetical protein [Klebsiella pneumoniae]